MRTSDIRIGGLKKRGFLGGFLQIFGPVFDWILGVDKIRKLYEESGLQGREKVDFVRRFLEYHHVDYSFREEELSTIPGKGPLLLVANHPLGGLEGIILSYLLHKVRPDYKLLVNIMLTVFKELEEFYIFTNPMITRSKANFLGVKACRDWVREDHALLLFPAGRVGLFSFSRGYITDERWNRISIALGHMTKAPYVPIYINSRSSVLFSVLCVLFYPNRLLLLGREFVKSLKKKIDVHIGKPIDPEIYLKMPQEKGNFYLRMRTYLLSGSAIEAKENYSPPAITVDEQARSALKAHPPEKSAGNFELYHFYDPGHIKKIKGVVEKKAELFVPREPGINVFLVWDKESKLFAGGAVLRHMGTHSFQRGSQFLSHIFKTQQKTLKRLPEGIELLIFRTPGPYERDEVSINLLWDGIDRLMEEKGMDRIYGAFYLPAIRTPIANALIDYTYTHNKREKKEWKRFLPLLHREVMDYIRRFGLSPEELEEIFPALEREKVSLPLHLTRVMERQGEFLTSSRREGELIPPALMFSLSRGS